MCEDGFCVHDGTCTENTDCPGGECEDGYCVECRDDSHCRDDEYCDELTCKPAESASE